MQNPHIIVDPVTKRCLCGIYNGQRIVCPDLISGSVTLANLTGRPEAKAIADVFRELTEDRD